MVSSFWFIGGLLLVAVLFWFVSGNSYNIEDRKLKVRGGISKNIIAIDDMTQIYDTDVRGPVRLNDGKTVLYINTRYDLNHEIVFIKTSGDANYVLSFSNPATKDRIYKEITEINKGIQIIRE